jgi:hypothetical protein
MKLQATLIAPLIHTKGYAAPETKAAVERANLLIEQAKAIGEQPEDPLLIFSVLWGFCLVNIVAGNNEACREVADRILALAEKQEGTAPLIIGHSVSGLSLIMVGEIAQGRAHLNQLIALYDPAEHRLLAPRLGQDPRASAFAYGSIALWMLGHPEAALADADRAIKDARESGHATSLMFALALADLTYMLCGNYEWLEASVYASLSLWRTRKAVSSGRCREPPYKVGIWL